MTDYARFRSYLEVSAASDYSRAKTASTSWTDSTPTQVRLAEELSCATSGTTLSLAHLATCALIVIKNTDTTNYVTVTFKTNAGTGTAYSMKLTAGQEAVFRDIYATGGAVANWTITANTSAVVCEVSYVGT